MKCKQSNPRQWRGLYGVPQTRPVIRVHAATMHDAWTDWQPAARAAISVTTPRTALRAGRLLLVAALICSGLGPAHAVEAEPNAAALRVRYRALQAQPGASQFKTPLHLESGETINGVAGNIHALVEHPFAMTSAALNGPERWCDILLLHLNTKYCRASTDGPAKTLRVYIGKKHDQALEDAYQVNFAWRVVAASPDYLKIMLTADEGPLSTHDYRIMLEAVPLDDGRTLLHLAYSYSFGFAGRLAMQAYLGTIASDKLGFTPIGKQADGQTAYIGGMRGLVERNTMRYYLAIESYLGALSAPPQARLEKSLRDWFAAVERHPRQLHELDQDEYLGMKRKEYARARLKLGAH
ncbi:MAG: hypothetical protein Q8J99_11370 [Sulfuritalea sp.]|nr:hypothetical protein [Sulfuritalea sp.]